MKTAIRGSVDIAHIDRDPTSLIMARHDVPELLRGGLLKLRD